MASVNRAQGRVRACREDVKESMRQLHVTVTWQSEHLVEVDEEADLSGLMQVLGGQSNVRMLGFTAQPLDEVVDAAVDRLLGPGSASGEA